MPPCCVLGAAGGGAKGAGGPRIALFRVSGRWRGQRLCNHGGGAARGCSMAGGGLRGPWRGPGQQHSAWSG